MGALRPRHGEYDAALMQRLARLALARDEAGALVEIDAEAAATFRSALAPLAQQAELTNEAAIDFADALEDALGITAAIRGELRVLVGQHEGQCRDFLLGVDGEVLAERAEGDQLEACAFGCAAGRCLMKNGASVRSEKFLRDWLLCGGLKRTCWPRAGGLEEQASEVVWAFQELDAICASRATTAGATR